MDDLRTLTTVVALGLLTTGCAHGLFGGDRGALEAELMATKAELADTQARLQAIEEPIKRQAAARAEATHTFRQYFDTVAMRARYEPVSIEKACRFFNCDDPQTRDEVIQILNNHKKTGRSGWRVNHFQIDEKRTVNGHQFPETNVSVYLWYIDEYTCRRTGPEGQTDGGVKSCAKAVVLRDGQRPRQKCHGGLFNLQKMGDRWVRSRMIKTPSLGNSYQECQGLKDGTRSLP